MLIDLLSAITLEYTRSSARYFKANGYTSPSLCKHCAISSKLILAILSRDFHSTQ